MYDLNDAQPQMPPIGELIPDGTFAKLKMTIRPGGLNGSMAMDAGLLKASQSSDAKMLDCEFTVMAGPYIRRKFWQMFTVAGGKLDEKGQSKGWNISKSAFRAMVDSALGLDSKDESQAAKQKRVIQGLKQLDGIVFAGRIMVEPASNPQYKDQNRLCKRRPPRRVTIRRHHARPTHRARAGQRQAAQDRGGRATRARLGRGGKAPCAVDRRAMGQPGGTKPAQSRHRSGLAERLSNGA